MQPIYLILLIRRIFLNLLIICHKNKQKNKEKITNKKIFIIVKHIKNHLTNKILNLIFKQL